MGKASRNKASSRKKLCTKGKEKQPKEYAVYFFPSSKISIDDLQRIFAAIYGGDA